jgi:two-component system chemotaxis sensor kinase CheA
MQLSALLGRRRTERAGGDARVLVVVAGDQTIGIEVDGFAERIEVMVRPLAGLLTGMPGFLGTALMGDGRVLMVLNLPELAG